jgi:signal transduction histidine kinase
MCTSTREAIATVRLSKSREQVCVQVSDLEKGMTAQPARAPAGVGINGMRERLRELGGTLNVHSNGCGTLVRADLPIT